MDLDPRDHVPRGQFGVAMIGELIILLIIDLFWWLKR